MTEAAQAVVAKIWGWIVLLLASAKQQQEEPAPVAAPTKQKPAPVSEAEQFGQFYFKSAVLDQLDLYFHYIKRMKANDPDAYHLYRQVGAQVVPRRTILAARPKFTDDEYRVSSWFASTKPAFGAISYGLYTEVEKEGRCLIVDDHKEDLTPEERKEARAALANMPSLLTVSGVKYHELGVPKEKVSAKTNYNVGIFWTPKFIYFTKFDKAPVDTEQHQTGTIYKLTVYWDRNDKNNVKWNKKHKGGVPQEYGLWITPSGEIRVLRQLEKEYREVRSKVRIGRHSSINGGQQWKRSVETTAWTYPSKYLTWCEGRLDETPLQCLVRTFVEATRLYEQAAMGSMIRIEAAKGDVSAVFGVEVKRTAYFFKDRDDVLDPGTGKKKRIFHIVRPHQRADGSTVKMHFRGLRQFVWNGYRINITVPGKHHEFLPEFDLGAVDRVEKGERCTRQSALGEAWRAHFHGKSLIESLNAIKFKPERRQSL